MKFLGHPVHQMLVVFPLGLLATAVVFDLIYLVGSSPTMAVVSYWMIAAGVIGGLLSAPFGWIDWFGIPTGTRAKSIGLWHGVGNIVVLLLFVVSWFVRNELPEQAPRFSIYPFVYWRWDSALYRMVRRRIGGPAGYRR